MSWKSPPFEGVFSCPGGRGARLWFWSLRPRSPTTHNIWFQRCPPVSVVWRLRGLGGPHGAWAAHRRPRSAAPFGGRCGAVVGSLSPARAPLRCVSVPFKFVSVVRSSTVGPGGRPPLSGGPAPPKGHPAKGPPAFRGPPTQGQKKERLPQIVQLLGGMSIEVEAHTLPRLA